ncbi:hypothetical protein PTUN_a0517 [Pseudoalteromonas tunicata]|jgi:uncharacterized membrane protein YphA (DoxX/SURF4 family)|uniref:DUF2798 domain-containing protein n=2 Tax=Pseudoalteromonas tunicata TaxID=314281 RepID=A4C878_9GAMM|nr:hypothetical protein PTUN_a0517 [Pseudoalteromonas tunicata]AXT32351.1 DUF2798 domain-containing protein [Pseudoalteromonas tunicata]EAR28793.1 hypothetical protein PTD2_07114 [Pseudoalteromonas tunicata D2]
MGFYNKASQANGVTKMSKKELILTIVLCTFVMAFLMSGLMTLFQFGFTKQWVMVWAQGFPVAWFCAIILNALIIPHVRRFASYLATDKVQRSQAL